ncbi:hypothetical protein pb186bvf_015986 [Paramecium bursaria]
MTQFEVYIYTKLQRKSYIKFNMKVLGLLLAVLVITQARVPKLNNNFEDVYLIFKGILEGIDAQAAVQIDEIIACVQDTEKIEVEISEAIPLFIEETPKSVAQALELLGEAISDLPKAINECKAAEPEFLALAKVLANLIEQLRHPLRLVVNVGENLIVNGAEIYGEINTAVVDYDAQNFEDLGLQVGKILVQLLQKMENIQAVVLDLEVTLDIFDGVLDGIVDASGIRAEDVEQCIEGTQTIVVDFEGGVRLFETWKKNDMLQSFSLFADGLDHLPAALTSCRAASVEAANLARKLTSLIASLRSPQSFVCHIAKDLIVNGKDIYVEVLIILNKIRSQPLSRIGRMEIGMTMDSNLVKPCSRSLSVWKNNKSQHDQQYKIKFKFKNISSILQYDIFFLFIIESYYILIKTYILFLQSIQYQINIEFLANQILY